MELSGDDARNIVYGNSVDWKEIQSSRITGQSRWCVEKTAVFQHIESGAYYRFNWRQGATEGQDERAYEYEKTYSPQQVTPIEETITKYVPVE